MKNITQTLIRDLKKFASSEKENFYPKFFKAEKGDYGYGDKFLGVTVPNQRKIAKFYAKELTKKDFIELLDNQYHEVRLTALLAMVIQYQNKASTPPLQEEIVHLYQSKMNRINNWDLVDTSADKILGHYYFDRNKSFLHNLTKSKDLWEVRIGILSSFYFIRKNQYNDTLLMCKRVLDHPHDLIHKASGWMLREIGKRDKNRLLEFLKENIHHMPRTMLRYAIEKLSKEERTYWLTK